MNATSDLEYFMCDMCRVYMHRDIFCDHRRQCKGPDSKELKKHESEAIGKVLDDEQRKQLLKTGSCGRELSTVAVEKKVKLQEAAVRREVANEYARKQDAEAEKAVSKNKRVEDFMATLDDE